MWESVPVASKPQTASATPGREDSSGGESSRERLASIDAYRGLVMFLMMAEVLQLAKVAEAFPDERIWRMLADQQTHVEWTGCTLHDLIQPSFTFLVGVALPFSLASRIRKGQSRLRMGLHAAWRSVLLIALGIFLRSTHRSQTNFTFEDTLTQIGLGYFALFLLAQLGLRFCLGALGVILTGYWVAFLAYPLPGPDFSYPAVGVPENWPYLREGFLAHWNKNNNIAWYFDTWFLNLFPREKPFLYNGGGYATLSFIPTLGTMLLGYLAGAMLQSHRDNPSKLIARWITVGLGLLLIGYACDFLGVCPSVKRIWTPSWTLFSAGWCFLFLAAFYATTDAIRFPGWTYPLRVLGMNSIVAYVIAHLWEDFVRDSFRTHLGRDVFHVFGPGYAPFVEGVAVLSALWLILFWMARNKILVRI